MTPAPADLGSGRPVEVLKATTHDFTSRINGRAYRVYVGLPSGKPPEEGFPAVYVMDGNWHFTTALEVMRQQSMSREIHRAVVVGIGYQSDAYADLFLTRFMDLTVKAPEGWLESRPDPVPGLTREMTGGIDAFLDVLEHEIKPAVAAMVALDRSNETLLGHSLSGLAALHCMFHRPELYRTYVASSPSIWWADRVLLKSEPDFAARVEAGEIAPRVFLNAGALEQTTSPASIAQLGREVAEASIAGARMVDNAAELGARLTALKGAPGYEARCVVFPDEGHISVTPGAISRGLGFALKA